MLYDITRPMDGNLAVWPGDAPYRLGWTQRLVDGAAANTGALCCSTHFGTHVDAPLHVLDGGRAVGRMPLEAFLGSAWLVEVGPEEEIGRELVERVLPEGVERVLFRSGCWGAGGGIPERYPSITAGGAHALRERGVRLVGTDAPSVDPPTSLDLPAHRVLCGAGTAIVENLLLDGVPPGAYRLIALPLRLEESDASPVRAVLIAHE